MICYRFSIVTKRLSCEHEIISLLKRLKGISLTATVVLYLCIVLKAERVKKLRLITDMSKTGSAIEMIPEAQPTYGYKRQTKPE